MSPQKAQEISPPKAISCLEGAHLVEVFECSVCHVLVGRHVPSCPVCHHGGLAKVGNLTSVGETSWPQMEPSKRD